jgi:hypothetical protein
MTLWFVGLGSGLIMGWLGHIGYRAIRVGLDCNSCKGIVRDPVQVVED